MISKNMSCELNHLKSCEGEISPYEWGKIQSVRMRCNTHSPLNEKPIAAYYSVRQITWEEYEIISLIDE
jgi:hypothetical protein